MTYEKGNENTENKSTPIFGSKVEETFSFKKIINSLLFGNEEKEENEEKEKDKDRLHYLDKKIKVHFLKSLLIYLLILTLLILIAHMKIIMKTMEIVNLHLKQIIMLIMIKLNKKRNHLKIINLRLNFFPTILLILIRIILKIQKIKKMK